MNKLNVILLIISSIVLALVFNAFLPPNLFESSENSASTAAVTETVVVEAEINGRVSGIHSERMTSIVRVPNKTKDTFNQKLSDQSTGYRNEQERNSGTGHHSPVHPLYGQSLLAPRQTHWSS